MPAESLSSAGTANARLVYMSDFLELLAADAANSSDFTDRSGISATDRARTVLFECLFNHLADDRVASLFTILASSMILPATPLPATPLAPPPAAVLTLKKSWPILAEHV